MHHITDKFVELIRSLCMDYKISTLTDSFSTSPSSVRRRLLQSNSISPLVFNLLKNKLISSIKKKKSNFGTTFTTAF